MFQDFYEVHDNEQRLYSRLETYLDGRGVPDIEEAIQEIILQPVRSQYRELVNPGMLDWLLDIFAKTENYSDTSFLEALNQVQTKSDSLLKVVRQISDGKGDVSSITSQIKMETSALSGTLPLRPLSLDAGSRFRHRGALLPGLHPDISPSSSYAAQ